MPLFHFSDRGDIDVFKPQPVDAPAARPAGMDWLNGPLVWAVDDWHQPLYLFPHDCPRVFAWPVASTTPADQQAFRAITSCRMVAHIEGRWLDRLSRAAVYRYTLPETGFEALGDAGIWVARGDVMPEGIERIADLPGALEQAGVELRVLPSLQTLEPLWSTSLHVSAIRMRNSLH